MFLSVIFSDENSIAGPHIKKKNKRITKTRAAAAARVLRKAPFFSRLENQRHKDAEYHSRRDAAGGGGEAAGKDPQPALFRHGLGHALCQSMAEARQGYGGTGTAPVGNGLVYAQGAEDHAHHYVARQNAGGGELGFVDQDLADGAQDTAAEECVEIVHEDASRKCFLRSVFPGMEKLCRKTKEARRNGPPPERREQS